MTRRDSVGRAALRAMRGDRVKGKDGTSRRHPFLGVSGQADTVKINREHTGQIVLSHTWRVTFTYWLFLSVFGLYPLFILLNDAHHWFEMGPVKSNFAWYALTAIAVAGGSLFGFLLFAVKRIELNTDDRELTYMTRGKKASQIVILLSSISDVSLLKHHVIRRGGTRIDVASTSELTQPSIGTKYTVKITLADGSETYPLVTGNEEVARQFVRILKAELE